MSVEFEEKKDQFAYAGPGAGNNAGGLTSFLVKKGWAKDARQAGAILLIVSVVSLALAVFVFNRYVFISPKAPAGNPANARIIQGYLDQGLRGKALLNKIKEAREAGILK